MTRYSIAQAKDQFSKLVDSAIAGEDVTITRHGKPVAELRGTERPAARRPSRELMAQIFERAKKRGPMSENAVDIIRRMRDGEHD